MSNTSNPNMLPSLSVSATQTMRHNNAFGGNAVNITFGIGVNGWSACAGREIEVWGQGYVDLLARNGSSGLKYTFGEALEAGVYYLKWLARGRWPEDTTGSSAKNGYNVQLADSLGIIDQGVFEASVIAPSEDAESCGVFFKLSKPQIVSIAFIPTGSGTRGPLIGVSPTLEKVEIEVVQTNYPNGIVGNSDDCSSYSERIIEQDAVAWITGQPEAANLVACVKCSSLKNWSASLSIRSERSERETADNRDERFENLGSAKVNIASECIGGIFTLTVTKLVSQENVEALVFPNIKFKVRGRNPMDAVARALIDETMGDEFPYAWAIAAHESYEPRNKTTYNQFNSIASIAGTPCYGYPDGWGIGQIDYSGSGVSASTKEVYNWRTNIASMKEVLEEKKRTYRRIKEKALAYWESIGAHIAFPETYVYQGQTVSTEMLSVCVYYNGATGRNGDAKGSLPKYSGSSFPWELNNGILVFVDNGNNYAKQIVAVLSGNTKYVE